MTPEVATTSNFQKANYSVSFAPNPKVESTEIGVQLTLNISYFTTIPGIIKIIQLVIAILCMALISPPLTWFSRWFTFMVALSFALTLILCVCNIVTVKNGVIFAAFNCILAELIYTAIVTISLLITSIILLSLSSCYDYKERLTHYDSNLYNYFGSYIAAGVFGLLNFIAYATGTCFLFLNWKYSRKPNTARPASDQT